MKDREEFLPWSSGNATTAATVKKKYQVSGFFKVSKYRQEKLFLLCRDEFAPFHMLLSYCELDCKHKLSRFQAMHWLYY